MNCKTATRQEKKYLPNTCYENGTIRDYLITGVFIFLFSTSVYQLCQNYVKGYVKNNGIECFQF